MAASSVVGIIGRSLFDGIARQIGYLCKYKSNTDDFKKEVEKLKVARELVQRMVDNAKRNGEEIEEDVENWLRSVDKIMDEAGRFAEKEEKANNATCPNLMTRYQLSKRAVREMKDVSGLEEKGNFCTVSVRSILGEKWFPSEQGYGSFESRISIMDDILDSLNNPKVNMIGVYGMAGVGKTTLVKEVARRAKKVKLFDEAVFAWASRSETMG